MDNIAAGDSVPEWRLVPNDNNIGQRNVYPISGGGTSGLTEDFNRLSFQLKNPHLTTAATEVRTVLPSFLDKRGWKIEFLNRGGGSFPLAPGESRNMIIRLVPGGDFSPADVAASPDKTIQLYGYAGGILVGGMSYVIDPNLKPSGPRGSLLGSLSLFDLRHRLQWDLYSDDIGANAVEFTPLCNVIQSLEIKEGSSHIVSSRIRARPSSQLSPTLRS